MAFQPVVLQLGPIFFQVIGRTQQKQLQRNIRPSPHQETLELAVAFPDAKGTFYLNGLVHPKQSASLGNKLPVSLCSALCKLLANFDFFAEVRILGFRTLFPHRAACAFLASIIAVSGNHSTLFL